MVRFLNQLKFHTFRQPRVLSAVKTENMGEGNLPNDTLLLPVCPLLNLHNPIFPIENFIHSILRLHLVRAGALHASRRARWARWQELEFAEVDAGQKWMVFSTTPAPFNSPPVGSVCSSFEKCIAGALITLAKGRSRTRGGMARWQEHFQWKRVVGSLVDFFWFFGSLVDSFLVLWFFGWGIKDKTSELEVKVHN